jgi:competence protein ComEC
MGIPMSSWATLALAVCGALTIAGELASDVGFQLSVLAATGVLAGSDLWRFRPLVISTALSASVSAQAMVSPVLLAVFGSIPVLAPIANVIAGPLVVAATSVAGIGVVVGSDALVSVAAWISSSVLAVAEVSAPWPQVEWAGWVAAVLATGLLMRFARSLLIPVLAVLVAVIAWPASQRPAELPSAVFLDVGQGDATLLFDEGLTVLIDGGPDPVVMNRKLERYGVDRIDVVIVTHVHADHIVGLEAVLGRLPVGLIVADFEHHTTPASEWLLSEARNLGIDVVSPERGWRFGTGSLDFEFIGPLRRYASPNDESVVVLVTLAGERILMSGDVETFAQGDLTVPDVDVLKVPHQGAATSDLGWLARHAGHTAVVSVGPNQFGHPSPDVVGVLAGAGAEVHRTDLDGDLVVSSPRVSG